MTQQFMPPVSSWLLGFLGAALVQYILQLHNQRKGVAVVRAPKRAFIYMRVATEGQAEPFLPQFKAPDQKQTTTRATHRNLTRQIEIKDEISLPDSLKNSKA